MKEKLIQLYNTLGLIETKGNNTLIMATCLNSLEQFINECDQTETSKEVDENVQ